MCGRMFPEESDEVEKYVSGLPDMIRGNRSLEGLMLETIRDTNNKTRDRTLGGLTLPGLERRGSTLGRCPCVQNATITTKGHVLLDVTNVRGSAIWLVTAGVPVQTIIITIVGTPEQLKMPLLAMIGGLSEALSERETFALFFMVEEWKPW
ncbi:hypothetical protein Tco_0459179 [Tanacetum coccineum]